MIRLLLGIFHMRMLFVDRLGIHTEDDMFLQLLRQKQVSVAVLVSH